MCAWRAGGAALLALLVQTAVADPLPRHALSDFVAAQAGPLRYLHVVVGPAVRVGAPPAPATVWYEAHAEALLQELGHAYLPSTVRKGPRGALQLRVSSAGLRLLEGSARVGSLQLLPGPGSPDAGMGASDDLLQMEAAVLRDGAVRVQVLPQVPGLLWSLDAEGGSRFTPGRGLTPDALAELVSQRQAALLEALQVYGAQPAMPQVPGAPLRELMLTPDALYALLD